MRHINRLTQIVRGPTPASHVEPPRHVTTDARVSLATGASVADAIDRLSRMTPSLASDSVLVIPSRSTRPLAAVAVAEWLRLSANVTFATPSTWTNRDRSRWASLSERVGARRVVLGATGWARVDLGSVSELLGYVDLPDAIAREDTLVILRGDGGPPLDVWLDVAHARSALRAQAAGVPGVIELSLARDAFYVIVRRFDAYVVAALTDDRVAAELVAAALTRRAEVARGIEAVSPWEEPRVQSLVALAAGVTIPSRLTVVALHDDPGMETVESLAVLMGSALHVDERNMHRQ